MSDKVPGYMDGGMKTKYIISKRDGTPVDPTACYFVLRWDKDPHAIVALNAYAASVRGDNPQFAAEIESALNVGPEKCQTS